MNLRNYQIDFCNSVEKDWKENRSTCGVMFTGLGKTVCFAEIIRRQHPKRSLVIAHREELIFQAREKIHALSGLDMEIEMGDFRASTESGLFTKSSGIVSSIQTLTTGGDGGGRMGKFDPSDFSTLIIDECHHATAASYRRVIDYFSQNPALKILGVTATPDRADEESLGQVFESVAFEYEAEDAINDGWLVPVNQQFATIGELDFSQVRTTAGDLNGADLEAVMIAEKPLYGVADASIAAIGNRRAITFCSSVNHARMLCEIFNRYRGGMAAFIHGKTDKDERRKILAAFKAGKIQVVCNCGVLTEGFDDPAVEVIIMARPTKSRALYAQMLGRGMRALPGIVDGPSTKIARRFSIAQSAKPNCIVLDFAGNSGKHKLVTAVDILGGKYSDEAIEAATIKMRSGTKPNRVSELLDEEEQAIQTERKAKQLAEEARRIQLTAKAQVNWKSVSPFDLLQITPTKSRGWDDGKQFSEKQRGMLQRNGADPDQIPYHRGKQLLAAIGNRIEQGLCSIGQMRTLKKYNINTDGIGFKHASAIIDAIAKNGWRKPSVLPDAECKEKITNLQPAGGIEDDNVPF